MTSTSTPLRAYQAVLALAAFLGAACGTGSAPPLAPQAGATAEPNVAAPPALWTLKSTLTSVTGSEICGWNGAQVGTSVDWVLDVRRSGTGVTFRYGDPMDDFELVGILDGEAFTAGANFPSYQPCLGQRREYMFESRVAGQFSADGNAITATETWTYRFESGQAIVFSFDWVVTRFQQR